jgi:hypothetical protein
VENWRKNCQNTFKDWKIHKHSNPGKGHCLGQMSFRALSFLDIYAAVNRHTREVREEEEAQKDSMM